MPNMLDYLKWRGDLTLSQDGLSEVDMLILSQLAYVVFGDLVPGPAEAGQTTTITETATTLLSLDPEGELTRQTKHLWRYNKLLLEALARSRRFGDMRLWGHIDSVSLDDEKQFAALSIDIGDGNTVVAYRGTDGTLVGWKENFNMTFESPVPAQAQSAWYLADIARRTSGALYLTGHSKGGNLAVYAAACCDEAVQPRIASVVNFDGPGFTESLIASPGYARIRDRLRVYIPHFSVVGMLLEHEQDYTIVQSDAKRVMQHDAFSWQVQGREMLRENALSKASLEAERIIRVWLESLDIEERKLFINAAYEMICNGDKQTIYELETHWPSSAQAVLAALNTLEPEKRSIIQKVLKELFSAAIGGRFPWHREAAQDIINSK